MSRKFTLVILAGTLIVPVSLSAQEAERENQPRRGHMMERLDVNNDQAIDENEFMVLGAERFETADLNGDGAVTAEEAEQAAYTAMEARMRERIAKRVARRMEQLDTDGDGRISREESEAGSKERFAKLDRNNDGVLTREDRKRRKHRGRYGRN